MARHKKILQRLIYKLLKDDIIEDMPSLLQIKLEQAIKNGNAEQERIAQVSSELQKPKEQPKEEQKAQPNPKA